MRAWQIPKIWNKGECWIIGGGSSIIQQFHIPEDVVDAVYTKKEPLSAYSPYMKAIHSKHVIGVNMAYQLGNWIDFCFFGDDAWFDEHRERLRQFRGIKVSCAISFDKPSPRNAQEKIKFVPKNKSRSHGISDFPNTVSWNSNSGAAAISLAYHLGATKIVLVGFDMKHNDDGNSHWHNEYQVTKSAVFSRHLKGFPGIALDAERLGLTILNASPNSAIDVFPRYSVEEILNGKI